MNMPNESSFTIEHTLSNPANAGIALIEAASIALTHLGASVDLNELIGISSLAFSNYVYNSDYNQHELEGRYYSPYSELISNYGIFESLTHYTGYSVSEVNGLSDDDIWKLIQFEILHERPFISMDPDFNVEVISGYKRCEESNTRKLIINGDESELRKMLQNDDPVFVNWGVFTRPNDSEKMRTPKVRQQTNLLNWVVKHGFSPKEFFQETRENYACGIHGLEVMGARIAVGLEPDELESFSCFVSRLLIKRKAASYCLKLWAPEIAQSTHTDIEVSLNAAAAEYQKLIDLFSDDQAWTNLFPKAIELERNALSHIKDACAYFPSAFG